MAVTFKGAKPGDYGSEIQKRFEALLGQAVLYTDQRLKQESPVDTGRFRASWQIGQDAIGVYDAGPQHSQKNKDRAKTQPPTGGVKAPKAINYVPGFEKIGKSYILHNTLPYAEKLADGSSKQASPGWIQQIAKDSQGWIQSQAGKIQ